jgi:hypothetical protein
MLAEPPIRPDRPVGRAWGDTPKREPGRDRVPLKMVTDVIGTVFSWIDTLLVPLPVAPTRPPLAPVTVHVSEAVPCAVSIPHACPGPASVIWSPPVVVRVDVRNSVEQSGAGLLDVSTWTTIDSVTAPRRVD